MKRKIVTLLLALCCFLGVGGLVACDKEESSSSKSSYSKSFSSASSSKKTSSRKSSSKKSSKKDSSNEEDSSLEEESFSEEDSSFEEESAGEEESSSENSSSSVEEEEVDLPANAPFAYELSVDGEYYKIIGVLSTEEENIIIPAFYTNIPVKVIGENAFQGMSWLTGVVIPSTVTVIEKNAFANCIRLTSIKWGKNVETIGETAFNGCTGLTSVTIPSNVTTIGAGAFGGCSSLQSITLPFVGGSKLADSASPVTLFGYIFGASSYMGGDSTNQYYSSNDMVTYYIPAELKSVTVTGGNILYGAFYQCVNLTSVTIPSSVTTIESQAFYSCSSLSEITIPSGVTTIGWKAFSCCFKLVEVINKSSLTITAGSRDNGYVGYYAKQVITDEADCKLIEQNDYIFYNDNETYYLVGYAGTATELVLPDNINGNSYQINQYAFYNNDTITSVTIPSGVTTIGWKAFYSCDSLTSVYITDIAAWCNIDFGSYDANPLYFAHNLYLNNELVTELEIPSTVTEIKSRAFHYCTSLTSVTIPEGVTTIGSQAFDGCNKLVEVINKSSLTITAGSYDNGYVGYYAKQVITDKAYSKLIEQNDYIFYNDNGTYYLMGYTGRATELTLPEDINGNSYQVYKYAFHNNRTITSVTIGSGVTTIGDGAFYKCTGLTEIYFNATAMEDLDSSNHVFANAGQSGTGITVNIGANVTKIPAYLFNPHSTNSSYTPNITSVVFAENSVCESIGMYAFYNCDSLTSVDFGDNSQLTTIGWWAFYSCSSLSEITIPSSVTTIGREAFSGCTSLTSVTFENTSGWYRCSSSAATSGTSVDVTDAATNATYLTSTYYNYYWKRTV